MPISKGLVGDKKVTVLRDTGCSGVVIRENLVDKEQYLDKTIDCVMIDGSTLTVPVARVEIDTPFYTGSTEAWCMPNPLYDVVLGNIEGVRSPGDPDPEWEQSLAVQTRAQRKKERSSLTVPKILENEISPEQIRDAQRKDPTLEKLHNMAKNAESKQTGKHGTSTYVYRNGLLYREFQSPTVEDGKVYRQLVIPQTFRSKVLKMAHESLMAGHLAARRTTDRILSEFFWPGVKADVVRHCRSCDVCQKTVSKGKVPKVPLGQMPLIDVPFQRVAVDIIGPLQPPSSSGNRYILTIVDYATRYPEAVALKTIDTEVVAEALVDVFCRVGVPKEMLTDMGTQFTSSLMAEVSRLLSMKQLTTTPYHPMCNGLVEKFNGTLKQMLRRMCSEQPNEWDKYLGALLFAYREVPQESLGFAPFELLYGRSVRGPMQILHELWSKEIPDADVKTTYQYVMDLKDRLQETCELAQESLKKSSQKYRQYYNRKARDRSMEIGDEVLVLLPSKSNKLLMQWRGPYKVTGKKGAMDYRVHIRGKEKLLHANLLKKYVRRDEEGQRSQQAVHRQDGLETAAVAVIELECEDGGNENHGVSEEEEIGLEFPSVKPTPSETYKDVLIGDAVDETQREQVAQLLEEFSDVLTDIPGSTNIAEHQIKTTTEDPVRVKQYPLPFSMEEAVKEEVKKMLEMDIIEPSTSPYTSPIVIVKKKDGTNRFCVDFRQLNKITIFDAEPMPNMEDMFARFAGYQYFSKVDLTKGYWQVPVETSAKEKTAFTTPMGLFQFCFMPFGLVNAPATFSRMMRTLLHDLQNVDNIIDDVVIFTKTWEDHLRVLRELFTRLRRANLTARPTKCAIGFVDMDCLGHVVGVERLKPHPDKIKAVQEAQRPQTKKQVRSFLGLIGFYRKFVPNFSAIAAPLTDLTKKQNPNKVKWEESHEAAFQTLKRALVSEPILKLPDVRRTFIPPSLSPTMSYI